MSTTTYETKSITPKIILIGLIAVVLIGGGVWIGLGLTGGQSSEPVAANALPPAPTKGHPAPDFTLTTLDGREVSLSDFEGQPVIINFWATWCGPCRVEMPHLQEAYTTHQDEGLVVLGVNLTQRDSVNAVPGFLDEFGLTFPIVLDKNGNVAEAYNVIGQPASVFVNKDGTVHEVFYGPVNRDFIDQRISELFNS